MIVSCATRLEPLTSIGIATQVTIGPGDMIFVPCELIHHVYNEDETIALSYGMIDQRSGTCAANLKAAGSKRFEMKKKGRDDEDDNDNDDDDDNDKARMLLRFKSIRDLRAFEDHRESQVRAGTRLLDFPEQLDEDLSWEAFNERYCAGKALIEAQAIRAALDQGG